MHSPDVQAGPQQARDRRRRPWLAAVLSLVLPGLGQLYAGQLRRGVAVFAILSLATLVNTWVLLILPPTRWTLAFITATGLGLLVGAAADAALVARRAPQPYQPTRGNRWYVYGMALAVGLGVGSLGESLRDRFLEGFRTPSAAMAETLMVGDWFFVDKRPSTRTALSHGAIVVYESPDSSGDRVVKRIVGLAGDTLAARNDTLIRNGRAVVEPYARFTVARTASDSAWSREMGNWGPLRVPADSMFVLGDNRHASKDSRHVGFIPTRNVLGKPRLIYYSYDPEGDWPIPFLTGIRWNRLGMMPE